jgi:type II secretory pathway component PulK
MMLKKKNDGIILVLVLIFTVAISTLVILFQSMTKNYTDSFATSSQNLLLENAAEMGIEIGKEIIRADKKSYDTNYIDENPSVVEKQYEFEGINLHLKIEDQNARINPNMIFGEEEGKTNTLLMEIFKRFFVVLGYPENLCSSILDWIDEDKLERPGGAEDFYYNTAGLSYTPPNRNIYTTEELLLIRDFTEEIVYGNSEEGIEGLVNFITFFSDGKINVNTCRPEILNAIGFTSENTDRIVEERTQRPIDEKFLIRVNRKVYLKNKRLIVFKGVYFTVEVISSGDGEIKKQVKGYIKADDKKMYTVRNEIR